MRVALGIVLLTLFTPIPASPQYKGDRIPGNVGLEVGSQAPPGIYVGYLGWFYPTDTLKDANGDPVGTSQGSLRTSLNGFLVSWVTPVRIAGANLGGAAALPFIRNRLEANVLDVDTDVAYTDTIFTPLSLGWHRGRMDALGPEMKVFIPQAKLTVIGRVMPEFGARVRTEGLSVSLSIVYIAKSFARP